MLYLVVVQAPYPPRARKGQPYDSLLHLLDRKPSTWDDREREFLFDNLSSSALMATGIPDENARNKSVREQRQFDKALVLHPLESL